MNSIALDWTRLTWLLHSFFYFLLPLDTFGCPRFWTYQLEQYFITLVSNSHGWNFMCVCHNRCIPWIKHKPHLSENKLIVTPRSTVSPCTVTDGNNAWLLCLVKRSGIVFMNITLPIGVKTCFKLKRPKSHWCCVKHVPWKPNDPTMIIMGPLKGLLSSFGDNVCSFMFTSDFSCRHKKLDFIRHVLGNDCTNVMS